MRINLYDENGRHAATVMAPPMNPPPTVLLWGPRVYAAGADGIYRETMAMQVFTEQEHEAMRKDGIVT